MMDTNIKAVTIAAAFSAATYIITGVVGKSEAVALNTQGMALLTHTVNANNKSIKSVEGELTDVNSNLSKILLLIGDNYGGSYTYRRNPIQTLKGDPGRPGEYSNRTRD